MDRPGWAAQQHHRRGHSMGGGVREKDEDLALFKNMGKRADQTPFLYPGSGDQLIDATLSTKFGGLSHPHSAPPAQRKGIGAELLNSDVDKTDYDWLMTPPGTPLFPSLDADSPALQQGMIVSRSLAAIKTSRVSAGGRADVAGAKGSRGNPSPGRRSSTPQSGQSSASAAARPQSQALGRSSSSNRPATPTRSSTPTSIRASPSNRPSTPTRQNSAGARPVTPLGARPATPTRKPGTPSSSARPSSTPTLRRSSSSPTGSQTQGGVSARGNPSPTRSTASTGTSALRGVSPVRSTSSRGVSPVRGVSPAPSARGRSPSPSLRAPYPVDASDDIPPNLRTTSERPSPARSRAAAYGASPSEAPGRSASPAPPQRRTASPARSIRSSVSVSHAVERLSRAASTDSESSFDTCSQSGISSHGIVTPDKGGSARRMSYGRGADEHGRSSSLQKARRGSSTSPQLGPSSSKKSLESAAREYHRGQVAAFRPLMTNSSISTFYTSRASGLLRRPLTPSSTASSSEHGATVAHDSEVDDEDAGSHWKGSVGRGCEAQSPLQLFDKSLGSAQESGTLDGSSIADNEEMSSFFKNSELALEVEPKLEERVGHGEVNWLSRDEAEDAEYLRSGDVKDGECHAGFDSRSDGSWIPAELSKAVEGAGGRENGAGAGPGCRAGSSSGLEKIRDKLRHLKSSTEAETEGEGVESAATRAQAVKCVPGRSTDALSDPAGISSAEVLNEIGGGQGEEVCSVCGVNKSAGGRDRTSEGLECQCGELAMRAGGSVQSQEGAVMGPFSGERGHAKEEKARDSSRAGDMVYSKERDVWYIYRQSSEYGVPSSGSSEAMLEVEAPEVRGMEDWRAKPYLRENHSRGRESSKGAESAEERSQEVREEIVPVTAVAAVSGEVGRVVTGHGIVQSEHVRTGKFPGEYRSSGAGEGRCVAAGGGAAGGDVTNSEYVRAHGARDTVGPGSEGKPQCGLSAEVGDGVKACEQVMEGDGDGERGKQNVLQQGLVEKSRDPAIGGVAVEPVDMSRGLEEATRTTAPQSSWVPQRANVMNPESCISKSPTVPSTSLHTRCSAEAGRAHAGASRDPALGDSHRGVAVAEDVVCSQRSEQDTSGEGETRVAVDVVDIVHEPASVCTQSRGEVCSSEDASTLAAASGIGAKPQVEGQCRAVTAAQGGGVDRILNERDRASRGDEDDATFIDIPMDPRGEVTAELGVPEVIYKHAMHTGLVSESFQAEAVSIADDKPKLVPVEVGRVDSENVKVEKSRMGAAHDVWSSLKFPPAVHQSDRAAREDRNPTEVRGDGAGVRRFGSGVHAGCLSKSSSSKSSFRTPTSGSSIDLSRSTDTTSSCPSIASWEDPQYAGSKFWESRPACDVGRVSDAMERAVAGTRDVRRDAMPEQQGMCARGVGQEAKAGEMACRNGEVQPCKREAGMHDADARCGVPFDEEASEEHFDYIFEYLGSKRDPSPKAAEDTGLARVVSSGASEANPGEGGTARSSLVGGVGGERTSEANGGGTVSRKQSEVWTASKRDSVEGSSEKCRGGGVNSGVESREVTAQAASKDEIVESTVSPGSSTRKHMSSFKFSHRKSGDAESKRSGMSKQASGSGNPQQQQLDAGSTPGGRSNGKATGKAAVTPPHPQKGKSTRAGTPGRAAGADAKARGPAQGANGEVAEELSIQSRFSNITVRSGSDTENFDWGRSSLEETGSRRGSSSGTNTAAVAVLRSTGASVRDGEDPGHGDAEPSRGGEGEEEDEGDDEQRPRRNRFCPSRRSGETNSEASPSFEATAYCTSTEVESMQCAAESRNPTEVHAREASGWANGEHEDERIRPEIGVAHPMRPMRGSLNHAPKQNLDKLSEKLEQLETFGARVVLRNPQQQLMHSPRTGSRSAAGDGVQDCGGTSHPVRPETSSRQSKCRCTVM